VEKAVERGIPLHPVRLGGIISLPTVQGRDTTENTFGAI